MPQMTARERVQRALAFEEADIVPYDVRIDDAALPGLMAYCGGADLTARLERHLPFYNLESRPQWTASDYYVDAFGCGWRVGNIPHLEHSPLHEPSLRGYRFPNLCEAQYFEGVEAFLARHRGQFVCCGDAHGFYDRCWALRGLEAFLTDLVANPGFVAELVERLTELHLQLIDRIAGYPFDGVRFADDWGYQRGIVIGAERWRKVFKPGLKRIFARARDKGLVVMVHSCGDVSEIVPDLIDMGVQILNPLQPEAMNVVEIKRRYGRHLCLNGGVSSQYTLPRGTAQEVREEALACLRVLGRGGGYVFSPSKSIMPDVPPANAVALIEVAVGQESLPPAATQPLPERAEALERVYAAFH